MVLAHGCFGLAPSAERCVFAFCLSANRQPIAHILTNTGVHVQNAVTHTVTHTVAHIHTLIIQSTPLAARFGPHILTNTDVHVEHTVKSEIHGDGPFLQVRVCFYLCVLG